ncbi:uncharacterized protein LOC111395320 [Olea europaea var. sylvestris]|uniref:uncharacterized protein LOC111395320 n=1 Tax=Olea europaea var. sylvestris TaxID=158386 RepID=UPI000C1D2703|nr:uncharacterized protein LOC111395320 [Olea europaea var. sylvestris]
MDSLIIFTRDSSLVHLQVDPDLCLSVSRSLQFSVIVSNIFGTHVIEKLTMGCENFFLIVYSINFCLSIYLDLSAYLVVLFVVTFTIMLQRRMLLYYGTNCSIMIPLPDVSQHCFFEQFGDYMGKKGAHKLDADIIKDVQMLKRGLHTMEFMWSQLSWTCRKMQKHYLSFCRNGVKYL